MKLRLIRQVLDEQVVDGNHNPLGKVDGVVVELRARGRPRVAAIQIGAPVMIKRLRQPMRGALGWFARKWHAGTMTIPWTQVQEVGIDLQVRLDGMEPESRAWERWIASHIIDRIPGA